MAGNYFVDCSSRLHGMASLEFEIKRKNQKKTLVTSRRKTKRKREKRSICVHRESNSRQLIQGPTDSESDMLTPSIQMALTRD